MLVNFDSLKTTLNGIKTYIDHMPKVDWNEAFSWQGCWFEIVDELPENPVDGVFYFIREQD